jgi:hypothetical protein
MMADYLFLRIGYDATGQGNFESPILIISQQGKKRVEQKQYRSSVPYYSAFDEGKYGYQSDGRKIKLVRK